MSLLVFFSAAATAAEPDTALTYENDIVPILQARCFKCHGPKVRKAGLDLRRRFTIVAGGESGAAIVPGKPDDSLLIEMIDGGDMPPKEEGPLDAKQIEMIRRWIAAGAPTKGDTEPPLEAAERNGRVTDEDRQFWAFQPPRRPAIPIVQSLDRVRNPIDAFLLAKLEAIGAGFNPDAPRRVLIRRLYFDLHGLPPTSDEIAEFLADQRPDAYERLVDRLLQSPRYGERWGRHWLDVAGYADSDGYLEADRLRPEAWRYRDYIIRALNDDKPYDRFIQEQIAGDELADWREAEELTPSMIDNLVATGFMRTALDPTYGNYAEPLECHKVMADTVQIVSSAFLGLTIQCARCHSHKYDPISQRDYYRMNAILLASYDPERWIVSASRTIPLATDAERERIAKSNAAVDARVKQLGTDLAELTHRFQSRLLDELLADVDAKLRDELKTALLADPNKRSDAQKQLVTEHAADVSIDDEHLRSRFPDFAAGADKLKAAVAAETALKKDITQLRGLTDLDAQPPQAHVLLRGDFNQPGREVEPGFPEVLVPVGFQFAATPSDKTTGRRMALAQWLTDPHHPLTARVHVNRVWAQHFGRGIVATLDNFGQLGQRPSHPALLDWLATEFIARGWSQKELHRLIVTSTAYRQSSQPNQAAQEKDPQNILLGAWRPQRHEGEVVRDSVLYVAGKLNPQMFGEPVPVKRHDTGRVTVDDNPAGNRRSIYLIVRRSQPVSMLELFDVPRMEINCTRRSQSIVVTQALNLLHSEFLETGARALARRILAGAPADRNGRIESIYDIVYGRRPSESELQSVGEFLDAVARAEQASNAPAAAGASDLATSEAAWQQLALVLLNSNEFLFVQ